MCAAKIYSAELRANNAIMATDVFEISLPLSMVVSYKGMRLFVSSVLPLTRSSHIFGSSDAGATIRTKMLARRLMARLCEKLRLALHRVQGKYGMSARVFGPLDIEGHHSSIDGRFYLLDTARMFPTFPPERMRYIPLRPELVALSSEPLSSDTFSRFSEHVEGTMEHEQRVNRMVAVLEGEQVAECASQLQANFQTACAAPSQVVAQMHRCGVNIRFLGAVARECHHVPSLVAVLELEMIARAFKHHLYKKFPCRVALTTRAAAVHPSPPRGRTPVVTDESADTNAVSSDQTDPYFPPGVPSATTVTLPLTTRAGERGQMKTALRLPRKWDDKWEGSQTIETRARRLFNRFVAREHSLQDKIISEVNQYFGYSLALTILKSLSASTVLRRVAELTGFSFNIDSQEICTVPVVKRCNAVYRAAAVRAKLQSEGAGVIRARISLRGSILGDYHAIIACELLQLGEFLLVQDESSCWEEARDTLRRCALVQRSLMEAHRAHRATYGAQLGQTLVSLADADLRCSPIAEVAQRNLRILKEAARLIPRSDSRLHSLVQRQRAAASALLGGRGPRSLACCTTQ
eukprot:NODE_541_length_2119_cov_14.497585_g499_i0.p1 GENE.NODE_541_length_2119_cov_14.497585_g499_i0~~NODE_541_length_2119_cov_14.497585_g499_i0.p1  ORF type:complete len:649 (-),score=102.48 NODE_541_length_2119_cov_14.497585_g499_i0:173-1906(-)